MKRQLFILLLILLTLPGGASRRRTVVIGDRIAPFPFMPVTDRYVRGSLASAATYIEAWTRELGAENVEVALQFQENIRELPEGYDLYNDLADSTFFVRILDYFDIRRTLALKDTIPWGSVMVIDREPSGDSTVKIVDIGGFEPSGEYLAHFREDIMAVKRFFSTPIAVLEDSVTTRDCYFGPSPMAAVFNRFQKEATGADISFFAPPRFDAFLAKGDIYIKDIYGLLSYDNTLTVVRVGGTVVAEFLEELYASRYYRMDRQGGDLVRVRTPYYIHDSPLGLSFNVNLAKKKGSRIESLRFSDNRPFEKDAHYTVALNSFRARWFTDRGCTIVRDYGDYKRELIRWMSGRKVIETGFGAEWKLVPERWVQDAAQRERITIF